VPCSPAQEGKKKFDMRFGSKHAMARCIAAHKHKAHKSHKKK
jgi:hypothetical protein